MKKCYNKLTYAAYIWHGLRRSIYACALCTLEDGILYEGLKLQKQCTWGQAPKTDIVAGNASELFFVENNLDAFCFLWEKCNC